MAQIDCYLGTVSPWCYLVGDRLERIAARHGAQVAYRPLDVAQLLDRTGGVRVEALHPGRAAYRAEELARWAGHLGMPLNLKPRFGTPSSAPSSYAIIAAQAAGSGDVGALVQAVLRAHWAEERDIADDGELRAILAENGFAPGLVDSGLFVGAETYGRNLEEAVAAGVFGVPFCVVRESGASFWGQDRLDFLDRHLAGL